ncbi:PREDICTED: uncharacterized protein LOC109584561 [Amphimedon queenslandica]|uniref:Uncharacterized protein n=1 Tax=Amphimedon queenslandica TaxID=400682 RepID=A0A1X7U6L2_AMPQE|nr:PREDICTED: uncharacterized protein LOC109584561 [Amphimedon queenslandica]|eukprot:XP_019855899.1 PREDICTED: uncharacterized protein LOC109584561 [Amphimedon queenslandica]
MAEELQIVFTNESRKQFKAVIFPDDSDIDESFSLTWLVFDSKTQNASLPSFSSIGFISQQSTVGPVPAPSGSSWLLVKEGETLVLTEDVKADQGDLQVDEPGIAEDSSSPIKITNTVKSSLDGHFILYKSGRPFFRFNVPPFGGSLTIPPNPSSLCFGLTKGEVKEGEVVKEKGKIFSPLATLELSYFSSGIDITVTDNPAGRPHVTIEKLQ